MISYYMLFIAILICLSRMDSSQIIPWIPILAIGSIILQIGTLIVDAYIEYAMANSEITNELARMGQEEETNEEKKEEDKKD